MRMLVSGWQVRIITDAILVLLLVRTISSAVATAGNDNTGPSAARRTPLVELIERCTPSSVSILTVLRNEEEREFVPHFGSGWVLHENGYIITNSHVVRYRAAQSQLWLPGGGWHRFRIVARGVTDDLALLHVDTSRPLEPLPLGRRRNVLLGEPVLVIGNASGLGPTMSTGIISRMERSSSDASIQVLQTDASVNAGNSGGPMINADGQLIGVLSRKRQDSENISFAIPVDRLWTNFGELIAAEMRYGFTLGLEVGVSESSAPVVKIVNGSPAALAGVRVGDVVLRVGAVPIRCSIDFYLALVGLSPGRKLALELRRGDQDLAVIATLGTYSSLPAVAVDDTLPGLHYTLYQGQWDGLPDFEQLDVAESGTIDTFVLPDSQQDKDHFALKLTGYVRVSVEGLHTFFTRSDDGSQLLIGDRLVVDNNGGHPTQEAGGRIRLAAGMHPITVTFYEGEGNEDLQVLYQGPSLDQQEIPASALSRTEVASSSTVEAD